MVQIPEPEAFKRQCTCGEGLNLPRPSFPKDAKRRTLAMRKMRMTLNPVKNPATCSGVYLKGAGGAAEPREGVGMEAACCTRVSSMRTVVKKRPSAL